MFSYFLYRCNVEDDVLISLAISDCFSFGLIDLTCMIFANLFILNCLIVKSALKLPVFQTSDKEEVLLIQVLNKIKDTNTLKFTFNIKFISVYSQFLLIRQIYLLICSISSINIS